MKAKELRKKSISELIKALEEKRKELEKLYIDLSTKKLKNNQAISHTKKEIARILTIINEQRFKKSEGVEDEK